MSPESALSTIIAPAMSRLPDLDGDRARVMLVAIGMQESRLTYRRQVGGPARGLWQFEKGGGVKGVLTHFATKDRARAWCAAYGVPFDQSSVYAALAVDDVFACGIARLLLWSDPWPLPTLADAGWQLYQRVWRPGKPHPATWPGFFKQAADAVRANPSGKP